MSLLLATNSNHELYLAFMEVLSHFPLKSARQLSLAVSGLINDSSEQISLITDYAERNHKESKLWEGNNRRNPSKVR